MLIVKAVAHLLLPYLALTRQSGSQQPTFSTNEAG
jgi:hypothetical protein